MMDWFDEPKANRKRTLTQREKTDLYLNAKKRCENPGCRRKLEFHEMQAGHKTAFAKGGATTLKNSVCLCGACNTRQGTDSWATFLKRQNVVDPVKAKKETVKEKLRALTITQLKSLATKHGITVKGSVKEDWFETRKIPPTKTHKKPQNL